MLCDKDPMDVTGNCIRISLFKEHSEGKYSYRILLLQIIALEHYKKKYL